MPHYFIKFFFTFTLPVPQWHQKHHHLPLDLWIFLIPSSTTVNTKKKKKKLLLLFYFLNTK